MKQLRELADEQLVSLFQKGNNNAFDILLKRYESKVFLISSVQSKIRNLPKTSSKMFSSRWWCVSRTGNILRTANSLRG